MVIAVTRLSSIVSQPIKVDVVAVVVVVLVVVIVLVGLLFLFWLLSETYL